MAGNSSDMSTVLVQVEKSVDWTRPEICKPLYMIMRKVFATTSLCCPFCSRPYMQELRNPQTTALQLVCKAWADVMRYVRITVLMTRHLTCNDGGACFDDYQRQAPMPGILRVELPVKVRRPKWKRAAMTPVAKSPCTEQ